MADSAGEQNYGLNIYQMLRTPRFWPSLLFVFFLRLIAHMPLRFSRGVGSFLGLLLYCINRKRRHIANVNIGLCFPQLSARERKRFVRNHFKLNGQGLTDAAFLAWANESRIVKKTRIIGLERYRQYLAKKAHIILLAPHLVGTNFGASFVSRERPVLAMAKGQKDPIFNWLLEKSRTRFGGKPFGRHKGMRPVVKGIKAGIPTFYFPDEDFGAEVSVFAPFFNVPAATLTTLGRLAALTEAVVIPCFAYILPGGRGYEIVLEAPLENFPENDLKRDAVRMNEAMENGIRRMPEQYMWTLKIFKTRPDNAPPPY
ncbi:MAG: lysophospholipid acyltransferase family protein [Gammaproteobacteria bacterium]|nr:lysophospholipid acyltransferase family protein [Gammaproteobacteria bacterium]